MRGQLGKPPVKFRYQENYCRAIRRMCLQTLFELLGTLGRFRKKKKSEIVKNKILDSEGRSFVSSSWPCVSEALCRKVPSPEKQERQRGANGGSP